MMRNYLIPFMLFLFVFPSIANAQVSDEVRQRRRALLEDVIRNFTETQPDASRQPPRVERAIVNSPELQRARQQTANFDKQLGDLAAALQNEELADQRVRSILADTLQLKSYASQLAAGAKQTDLQWIATNFVELDRNWRVLSYRIGQSKELNQKLGRQLTALNKTENELGEILKVPPQLNRAKLIRLVASMDTSIDHLLQDVYYDRKGQNDQAALVQEGQAFQTQLRQASSLIDRGSYENIVDAYRLSEKQWRSYARKLRSTCGERVCNDIVEIEQLGRSIHEQLWLPVVADREYVLELITLCERETTLVFRTITVNDLLYRESPAQLIVDARGFNKVLGVLRKSVETTEDLKTLDWHSLAFNKQWQDLQSKLDGFDDPVLNRRIAVATETIDLLLVSLGDQPRISRRQLLDMAAELDQISRQFELFAAEYLPKTRSYTPEFRRDFTRAADNLHIVTHQLHDHLVSRTKSGEAQKSIEQSVQSWRALKPLIASLNEQDVQQVADMQRQIQPLLMKLQMVLTD